MRHTLSIAVLALGAAATAGLSKDMADSKNVNHHGREPRFERHEGGHERAERALRDYYGDTAQAHIIGGYDIDGIRIFDAAVNRGGLEARATLTSNGEYITMGVPEPLSALPPGAQDTIALFKGPAVSIIREDIHAYWATIRSGNREFVVRLDAAGSIRDIKAPEQLREDANLPHARAEHVRHITDLTASRFAGIQVEGVFEAIHDPGYFMVGFRAPQGHGWAIINRDSDVTEWRFPIARESAPEAVRRGLERELHGDRVIHLAQGAERLYHVTEMVAGEPVSMLIKPDGAVQWISSEEPHRKHEYVK